MGSHSNASQHRAAAHAPAVTPQSPWSHRRSDEIGRHPAMILLLLAAALIAAAAAANVSLLIATADRFDVEGDDVGILSAVPA